LLSVIKLTVSLKLLAKDFGDSEQPEFLFRSRLNGDSFTDLQSIPKYSLKKL